MSDELDMRAAPVGPDIGEQRWFCKRRAFEADAGQLAGAVATHEPTGAHLMIAVGGSQGDLDIIGVLLDAEELATSNHLTLQLRQPGPQLRFDLGLADHQRQRVPAAAGPPCGPAAAGRDRN
jgi:hypothetical protein